MGRLGEPVGDVGQRRDGAGAGKGFVVEFGGEADAMISSVEAGAPRL